MASKSLNFCNHVKANGQFCKSPSLKNDDFCYFHRSSRERTKRQLRHARQKLPLRLPVLEDQETIQIAIGDVLNALLADRIDCKKAGLLLYGLQTAASHAHRTDFQISQFSEGRLEKYTEWEHSTLQKEIETEIAAEAQAAEGPAAESSPASQTSTAPPTDLPKKKPAERVTQEEFWNVVGAMATQNVKQAAAQVRKRIEKE